jgi:hypothetical protein
MPAAYIPAPQHIGTADYTEAFLLERHVKQADARKQG